MRKDNRPTGSLYRETSPSDWDGHVGGCLGRGETPLPAAEPGGREPAGQARPGGSDDPTEGVAELIELCRKNGWPGSVAHAAADKLEDLALAYSIQLEKLATVERNHRDLYSALHHLLQDCNRPGDLPDQQAVHACTDAVFASVYGVDGD